MNAPPEAQLDKARDQLPALVAHTYQDLRRVVELLAHHAQSAPQSSAGLAAAQARATCQRLAVWLQLAGYGGGEGGAA